MRVKRFSKIFCILFKISFVFLICSVSKNYVFAQQLGIDDVRFTNKDKKTFNDNVLSDAVGITKETIFKQQVLAEDIIKLSRFYFDNGFFDVKVDTAVTYNEADQNVIVRFLIRENKHYVINNLIYKGLDKIPADVRKNVDDVKEIKKNDFYNKALIIKQNNLIVDILQNNGYMNAKIKDDSGTVIIKYDTSLSVVITFERADTINRFGKTIIAIDENPYGVNEDLFPKVITYKEGDIYSKTEKLATEKNMSGYGIVQSARLEPGVPGNNGVVDFTAKILISKRNELTPFIEGATIDNTFYMGGGLKYINKYFLGGGKVLSLELQSFIHDVHVNRFVFAAGVTQPYVFNTHSSLSDKIAIGLYNLEGFKSYTVSNLTRLDYFFSEHTFYNNAVLDLTEEMDWFKFDVDSTGTLTLFNTFLNATIIHDNTDNSTSPTKGFYHSFSAGEGGLIPSLLISLFNKNVRYSQFVKLFTANRFYINMRRLMPTLVFASSFKVGDIMEYGKGDRIVTVQPLYRFFSGGSGSVRGWNSKTNGILANKLNGGEFLLEGSFELRKKLFPTSSSFTKSLGIAVFLDYGNVWETHKDFRFNQIALGVGFGPRYDLFLGPIRLDIGFKLYDPADPQGEKWLFNNFSRIFKDKYAITLGIGEAF